uniref:Uncharacterized protein LOC111114352 n=1 Tax=Crassostrea virginica TaxID=6565 RepID=A0A8B8BZT4_CRAVI|nr:uncharacterized protein LOC111114352 [Crassostrea virginica]
MDSEAVTTHLKFTEKQLKQSEEENDKKQTLSVSSSVTKVREYCVRGIGNVWHVSVDKLERLLVSDSNGNLVQIDQQGNLLQKIKTYGEFEGYHTATQDGDFIYTDKKKKVIYRITPDKNITEFIKTGDWRPLSIHFSRINEDILVGMVNCYNNKARVTRYNKTGKVLQNIQKHNNGEELYGYPRCITSMGISVHQTITNAL